MSAFYTYFKENMDGLGLPAPETLFATAQQTVATVAIFIAHIDKFGRAITVREMIAAGTRLEKLGVVAALSASYYVGAVIGSLAVALGRTLGRGTSLADVLYTANVYRVGRPWLAGTLLQEPTIYKAAGSLRSA